MKIIIDQDGRMNLDDVIPPHPGVMKVADTGIYDEIYGLKVTATRKRMMQSELEAEDGKYIVNIDLN